ncbi:MAG TPA: LON peptidase substrate-binding domain-containing protein [Nitrospira sp.]|nr:LON peptidase substrate-binding domain-containing protein [Nitrospira sp.]
MQTDREREHHEQDGHEKTTPFSIPATIPVFALPNVVLFPKTYLPLHIFEPRYRQMVDDAVMGGQCIGMALLKEGWESSYYGNPPVFTMGCVGRLVSVQPLADGRSNILLQGMERFEISEESYDKPYRRASITLKTREAEARLDPAVRQRLVTALEEYLRSRQEPPTWQSWFREDVSDDILVNTLSTYLDCTPLEKQFLLEADSFHQQARRLSDLIQFLMHDHHGAKGWG